MNTKMFTHHELLNKTLLSDVIHKFPMTSFAPETKLKDCLRCFQEHHFHSAPIFDRSTQEFVGIVEMMGLISYLMEPQEGKNVTPDILRHRLENDTCSQIPKRKVCVMEPTETISTFLRLHSIHKCRGTLVHLLKQFQFEPGFCVVVELDIIKFLAKNISKLGLIGSQSLEELHLFQPNQSNMVLLKLNERLIDGLKKMIHADVCVAGVVDGNGVLLGTLSETDLIDEFLNGIDKMNETLDKWLRRKHPFVPVTCHQADPLSFAIVQVAGASIHQLWIVDEARRPLGLVSLFDMLDILSKDNVATPSITFEKELLQNQTKSIFADERCQSAKKESTQA